MTNTSITYEQMLQMFGTEEEIKKYKESQERVEEMVKEIPTITMEHALRYMYGS